MAAKASLVLCATALFVQTVYGACFGGLAAPYGYPGAGCGYKGLTAPGLAYDGFAPSGCGCAGVASTGGGLPTSSASPMAPVGVSVLSENVYEGTLAAGGNLPFLGTVGIEGVLPTAGAGAVSYGCGDGIAAIGSEGPIATGIAVPGAIFPPGSPSSVATADALAMVPGAIGYSGLGGYSKYGLGGCGYSGLGFNRGCGCGAVY